MDAKKIWLANQESPIDAKSDVKVVTLDFTQDESGCNRVAQLVLEMIGDSWIPSVGHTAFSKTPFWWHLPHRVIVHVAFRKRERLPPLIQPSTRLWSDLQGHQFQRVPTFPPLEPVLTMEEMVADRLKWKKKLWEHASETNKKKILVSYKRDRCLTYTFIILFLAVLLVLLVIAFAVA